MVFILFVAEGKKRMKKMLREGLKNEKRKRKKRKKKKENETFSQNNEGTPFTFPTHKAQQQ